MSATTASAYLMGHTDHERRRLSLQASILNPYTHEFLRQAGLAPGMRVLDFGCGVGEVSMIAARLVGPHGHVTGIDIDRKALETAAAQARDNGFRHCSFEEGDAAHPRADGLFDAVIGRHILIHSRDPQAVVRNAVSLLRAGGVAAFQEYDFSFSAGGHPELPLIRRTVGMFHELFSRATPHPNIGMRLFRLMREAGLPHPVCRGDCAIDGGPQSLFYALLAETVRSLLPQLEALGIATASEIEIDTLETRIREETVANEGCIAAPMMIGAFARKP